MLVFGMEVEPEARSFSRPADGERNFGAGSILVKKRIDRLQQNRLPAGRHLRQLRVQSQQTVKIESVPVQAVLPRHVCMRPRNLKMQVGKKEHSLTQRKSTL